MEGSVHNVKWHRHISHHPHTVMNASSHLKLGYNLPDPPTLHISCTRDGFFVRNQRTLNAGESLLLTLHVTLALPSGGGHPVLTKPSPQPYTRGLPSGVSSTLVLHIPRIRTPARRNPNTSPPADRTRPSMVTRGAVSTLRVTVVPSAIGRQASHFQTALSSSIGTRATP